MKKDSVLHYVRLLAVPGISVLLGLVLLFSPDTASALLGKLMAWCCILAGAALGIGLLRGGQSNNRITWTVVFLAAGVWMLLNPLTIVKILGRVLGLLLLIRGAQNLRLNLQLRNGKPVVTTGLVLASLMALLGLVLILLPMATSRLVFSILGVVMIGVGVAEGYDRLLGRKQLQEGDDPNIIDVEKL